LFSSHSIIEELRLEKQVLPEEGPTLDAATAPTPDSSAKDLALYISALRDCSGCS